MSDRPFELQSRDEEILAAIIDGTEYTDEPQSRIEYLLLELKAAIEAGSTDSPIKYKGSKANIAALPTVATTPEGYMYTLISGGTTTADFVEGAGHTIPDGGNVVAVNTGTEENPVMKWDTLGGITDGLQPLITALNKLSADLVDDTNATHKFATSDQLNQIGTNTTSITTQKKLNDYLALFGAPNCCFNSEITQETTVSGVKFTPLTVPPVTSRGMVDVKGTATDDIDILYDSIELPSTLSGLVMTASLFVVYPYPITIITGYDPDSGDVLATLDGSQGITTVDFTLPNPLPRQISVVLHIANGTVADTTVALGIYPKELASLDGVSYGSTGAFSFRTNGEINEKIDELKTVIGDINTVLEGVL